MIAPGFSARKVAFVIGLIVCALSISVEVGWALHIQILKTVFPGLVSMKANTALGLLMVGLGQMLLARSRRTHLEDILVISLAVLLAALGALVLGEYMFSWNPHIDELLFRDPIPSTGTSAPGRMSPSTAFCLVVAGVGLLAGRRSDAPRVSIPLLSGAGWALFSIGTIGCIGQTTDVLFGFSAWNYFGMALHTAASTALLGGGFVALSRTEDRIPWTLSPRITAGFIGAIAILLIAAGFSWNYTHELEAAALNVGRTHETMRLIEEIRADRASAENAQRGFIIIGDEKLLANRSVLRNEIHNDYAVIRQLTIHQPKQQAILGQISDLMAQRTALTEQILNARRTQGFAAAQQMLASGPSLNLGAQIAERLAELQANEAATLAANELNAAEISTSTYLLLPVAVFLSLTLLSVALFFLNEQVDERARAQREVLRLNADLERRVAERTKELEASNKELEAFTYSVSHDLRSPVRAMDGFALGVMEDYGKLIPEEGARQLKTIRAGAQKMGALIDDLLAFSRLGRTSLTEGRVDMEGLAGGVIEDLRPEMNGRHVEIHQAKLPPCRGDPALLKQVWVNLISNAVKYSRQRDPAVIEIGCEENGRNTYYVRDNGAGFDMRYAGKLFGVFQRMHRADQFEGTGVGLAIVQRIVERHGGTIRAEAAVDRGATFYFTLKNDHGGHNGVR